MAAFLTATRGRSRPDWTDWVSYGYLLVGVVLMFGPVVWLVLSSFKTAAALNEFPPRLLPYGQSSVTVAGKPDPLPLYRVKLPDGSTRELVELRRIGIQATMVDPTHPDDEVKVNIRDRSPFANSTSRPRTIPRSSASSTSAASSGTACSSPWSRR